MLPFYVDAKCLRMLKRYLHALTSACSCQVFVVVKGIVGSGFAAHPCRQVRERLVVRQVTCQNQVCCQAGDRSARVKASRAPGTFVAS